MISRYQKRISGPLLDRIDIHVDVPRVNYDKLTSDRLGEPSRVVRARVEAARQRQRERFQQLRETARAEPGSQQLAKDMLCNADMGPAELRQCCQVDEAGNQLLKAAMRQMQLSARAYHRILKLARTIADLASSETIQTAHLAEAIQYRPRRVG